MVTADWIVRKVFEGFLFALGAAICAGAIALVSLLCNVFTPLPAYAYLIIGAVVAIVVAVIFRRTLARAIDWAIARPWVAYLIIAVIGIAAGLTALLGVAIAPALPWIHLALGILGGASARLTTATAFERTIAEWAAPSIVLRDTLAGPDTNAGGYIPKDKEGNVGEEADPVRGKVVRIGQDALIRYWKQLPLVQGTITLYMKFPERDQFEPGIILSTGNWQERAMPDLYLELTTDCELRFGYKRHLGGENEDWVDITHHTPPEPNTWYEVALTWGPRGMKIAVRDLGDHSDRKITSNTNFRQPIWPRTTHFGIGCICPKDNAAENFLVSDLRVTTIQEF